MKNYQKLLEDKTRLEKENYWFKQNDEKYRALLRSMKVLAQTNAYGSTTNLQNKIKSAVDICEHELHFLR